MTVLIHALLLSANHFCAQLDQTRAARAGRIRSKFFRVNADRLTRSCAPSYDALNSCSAIEMEGQVRIRPFGSSCWNFAALCVNANDRQRSASPSTSHGLRYPALRDSCRAFPYRGTFSGRSWLSPFRNLLSVEPFGHYNSVVILCKAACC
jgi:hypothetical protein